jgi:hypothetical protein
LASAFGIHGVDVGGFQLKGGGLIRHTTACTGLRPATARQIIEHGLERLDRADLHGVFHGEPGAVQGGDDRLQRNVIGDIAVQSHAERRCTSARAA